ncbi:MAG: hypothetical protein JNL44_16050 [Gemmatimonadetes bacterium]|nr:hypothetical protein [Gemmatimonadota bacterium]
MRPSFLVATLLFGLVQTSPLAAQGAPQGATSTPAPAAQHRFGWVLDATFEFGGERVAETFFTDGSSQTMTAGQGGTFAFGAEFRPRAESRLTLRGTVGYKFVTTAATNADIKMTRVPLEAVASWELPREMRVGAGLAYHTAIKFDGAGFGPNATFDPAAGATLELGWKFLALTYTAMDYRDEFGNDYDASALGVSLSWVFGKR